MVKDYYKLQKFNIMEIANAKNLRDGDGEGRISDKLKDVASEGNAVSFEIPPEGSSV